MIWPYVRFIDTSFSIILKKTLVIYHKILLIRPPYISALPKKIYAPQICNPINIPNISPPPPVNMSCPSPPQKKAYLDNFWKHEC